MDHSKEIDKFNEQFHWEQIFWLENLDFLNWYRFYFIITEILKRKPQNILEIGEGSGVVRRILEPLVQSYSAMDVNDKLKPEHLNDVRHHLPELQEKFDCVIAADVLEHIPFEDESKTFKNLYSYLKPGGWMLVTIPHRASNFLWMTPTQIPHSFRIQTGFLSPGSFYRRFIKRKIWIDPNHEWEIGDGHHRISDVESVMKSAGFNIEKRQALLYVDFWVLKK